MTLDAESDRHGMPVARFSYSQCDNDRLRMKALIGDRPETGVVDGDLRSFAVPNLWITDGSTLRTQGAANPALTIMALVARARRRDGRQGSPQAMLVTRGAQVTTEETLT